MNKSLNVITASVIAALSLSVASPALATTATNVSQAEEKYIVTYDESVSETKKNNSIISKGAKVDETLENVINGAVITATPSEAKSLMTSPGVLKVEKDVLLKSFETTQPSSTWGIDRSDQRDLPLNSGYTYSETGSGVKAYILDTGVKTTHSEFTGRVTQGFTAYNDGIGTDDCNGHGSHVASLTAGTTYGIAKKAEVVPVRILNCDGSGYLSDVITGIDWVIANHEVSVPAVANISLGGAGNTTLDNSVKALIADGVTVVAAAGNSSVDACLASPARIPEVITVAASDNTDTQSSFTNTGSCVDIYAPGTAVPGAYHTSDTAAVYMSGTSMSAPHAAGAAALILEKNKAFTPAQVQSALIGNATTGKIKSATTGTPNKLLFTSPIITPTVVATAPSAATNVRAYAGSKSASVYWTKGAANGSAINKQVITVYSGTTKVGTATISGTNSSVKLTGLTAGRAYSFTVTEYNSIGSSPQSAKSNIIKPTA